MHAGNLGDVVLERAGRPLAAVQNDLDLERALFRSRTATAASSIG
jgi:hypothetical protein